MSNAKLSAKHPLSRRSLLRGLGAGVAGASLANLGVVNAQTGGSQSGGAGGFLPLATERFELGDAQVTVISRDHLRASAFYVRRRLHPKAL